MRFEWDEAKRLSNLGKHGLDFLDAVRVFDGPHLILPARQVPGESRWLAVGRVGDDHVALVFTERDETTRIISMRRARHGERREHRELFG